MSRRLTALVIGNSAYIDGGVLKNPCNDANDVTAKLQTCGFEVDQITDCPNVDLDRALKRFKRALVDKDVGLFFFAGHGMQIDGENYLLAVNTDTADELAAKHSSIPLNRVIDVMAKADTTTNIIILDACRNNPFERAWNRSGGSRGLASVYVPKGTLIAFATSPGQVADDGRGRNAPTPLHCCSASRLPTCLSRACSSAYATRSASPHCENKSLGSTPPYRKSSFSI